MAKGLNPRQYAFAVNYGKGMSGTAAAIEAGYAEHTAHVTASRMLKKAKVQEVIREVRSKASAVAIVDAAEVLRGLKHNAERGAQESPIYDSEGREVGSRPTDLNASNNAWKQLGTYLRLFVERHEHTLDSSTQQRLDLLLDIISEEVGPEARGRIMVAFAERVQELSE